MNRGLGWAFASLISIGSFGSAIAADLAVKAPPPAVAPACVWCGFYVGGNAGYAWGRDAESTAFTVPPPFLAIDGAAVTTAASPQFNANGFSGGAQAGYNWQTGGAVFGLEADINSFNLRGSTARTVAFPSTLPGGSIGPPTSFFSPTTSVSTDWLFTGRGRLGWTDNNWLLYGTGGVAVSDVRLQQSIALLPPFVDAASISSTQVGWTVGAGFEYMVARNWSIKGEYLYVDLGKPGATGALTPAAAGFTYTTSARITANIARVGFNYHFGGPVVARY